MLKKKKIKQHRKCYLIFSSKIVCSHIRVLSFKGVLSKIKIFLLISVNKNQEETDLTIL